jgi:hypothetical protein
MDSARQMEQKRSLVELASFQDTLRNEETALESWGGGGSPHDLLGDAGVDLGFGRIVASEIGVPNMLANMV